MDKQLTIVASIALLLLAAMSCVYAGDTPSMNQQSANEQDALKILNCVKPDLATYWKGESGIGQDDFVIVYSVQGLFADIESRLPPDIVKAIHSASAQALAKDKITLVARDMRPLASDFYDFLQVNLSKLANLPVEACGIQSHRLISIFDTRYHFSMQGAQMDSWYIANHVNELNVKNDEFLALFARGSDIKGSCSVVFNDGARRVTVCK